MFHIQLRSGAFPGSLKTGKYESILILLLAKVNMSFTRKPIKCGTWILLSWEFFKYYTSYSHSFAHLFLSCEYFCDIFPVRMRNRRKKYIPFQLEYSEYFFLSLCSHWYSSNAYLLSFHSIYFINSWSHYHLNKKIKHYFFVRIDQIMSDFRQNVWRC